MRRPYFSIMLLILILGFFAVAPPGGYAAIPRYINYQGKLTDADDNPVTGDVSITLRIYNAEAGGTVLWTETQTVTVTRGIFSILLGNTTALTGLDFDDPYWYSVEVELDGEMTPRQRLTTVAYAINADKLDGYDAADFLIADTSEGTATGVTIAGGLITAGAEEDIEINPTGTGNVIITIDSTSGDFKITNGTVNFVLVDNDTGNVTIANDLTVSNITVTGTSDLRGNISNSVADGAVTIADALTVTGQTTISGALDLNSNLDLDYSGVSAALDVKQTSTGAAARFTGGPVIIGADDDNANIDSAGEVYIASNLEVDGTIYGAIESTGGDSTFSSLVVTGTSDLQGNVSDSAGTYTIADDISITATDSSTSGTVTFASIAPTFQDGGTDSTTTAIAMDIAPTINYTGASKTGSYTALKITSTETSLPAGSNYLIDAYAGSDGTTQVFYVDNSGNASFDGTVTVATPTAAGHAVTKAYADAITPPVAGGWMYSNPHIYAADTSDNVGIGTTDTGTYKLNVSGSTNTTSFYLGGVQVTSSAAELNKLDGAGATVTAANLDTLTNTSNADALHVHSATGISTNIVSSVEGVTNDGGNIDLVAGAGITIAGDDNANTITITGTVTDTDTQLSEDQVEAYIFDADTETILGDWVNTANPWADNEVANDLTISGGTIDNTTIGATTPAAATVTNLTFNNTGSATVMTFEDNDPTNDPDTLVYDSTADYPLWFSDKMSVTDMELRGASPAVISFGSGDNKISLIYDPATDEIRFSRGTFVQSSRNLVKNASFEAFSAFEQFHNYDPNYLTGSAYTDYQWDMTSGYQGGWQQFAPDDWTYESGSIYQHSPVFFKTDFTEMSITGDTWKQDFAEGVSAVRLEADTSGNPGKISQIIKRKRLKPSTVYSVGAKIRVDTTGDPPVNGTARVDIIGEDGGYGDLDLDTNTTLSSDINSTVKIIPVASVEDFPAFGTIKITDGTNTERIRYEGLDDTQGANKFLKCTRASTAYAFNSSNSTITVAPFVPFGTSTHITYKKFEGQFATDPKASEVTIVLSAEQGAAFFDTVQIVAGGTVPDYAPTPVLDTGDQTMYGSLRIGRASDEKGGILSVDKFVRTRGVELFTDDPGLTGATGGGMTTMGGGGIFPPGPGWNETTNQEPTIRLYVSGIYASTAPAWRDYKVQIDGTGSTYAWYYMDNSTGWAYQTGGTGISMPTSETLLSGDTAAVADVKIAFSAFPGNVGDTWWFNASNETFQDDFSYRETATYTPGKVRIYVDSDPSSPYFNKMVFEDGSTRISLSDLAGTVDTEARIDYPMAVGGNSYNMWLNTFGTYTGEITTTYDVIITTNNTLPSTSPDKFRWRPDPTDDPDDGDEWCDEEIPITGGQQALNNGIYIQFGENQWTGYWNAGALNDKWSFTAYAGGTASSVAAHTHNSADSGGLLAASGTTATGFQIAKDSTAGQDVTLNFYDGNDMVDRYIKWNDGLGKFEISNDVDITGTLTAETLSGPTSTSGTTNATFTVDTDLPSASTEPAAGAGFVIEGGTGDVNITYNAAAGNKYLDISGQTGETDKFSGINIPASAKYKIGGADLAATDIGAAPSAHSHLAGDLPADISYLGADIALGSEVSGTLPIANGGTNATSFTQSQLIRMNAAGTALESSGKTISDFLELAGGTMAGNIAMGSNKVTGLAAPEAGDDAATKTYVDNLITGLKWKDPVIKICHYIKTDAGAPTGTATDTEVCLNTNENKVYVYDSDTGWDGGTALTDGDRYLFAITGSDATGDSGAHTKDNNIYEHDSDAGTTTGTAPGTNWAMLVQQPSYDSPTDSGWTYDADATQWVRFTGAGQITAGSGLSKSANTINVNTGNGIQIDNDNVAVKLNQTASGLAVDADGLTVADAIAGVGLSIIDKVLTTDVTLDGIETLENKTLTNPLISQVYGGDAANDDITIEGTSNSTRTTSYVIVQPTAGSVGIGITEPATKLDVTGLTINTDADGTIGAARFTTTLTKNDTNARTFSGVSITPTLNTDTSNQNTTLNILDIDTVNTKTTGLTTNLIKASYGGAEKFKVDSAGSVTMAGDLTLSGGDITGAGSTAIDMGETTSGVVEVTGDVKTTGDLNIDGDGTSDIAGSLTVHGTLTAETLGVTSTDLSGTTSDAFTLNSDNTENSTTTLTFGGAGTGSGKIDTTAGALLLQPAAGSNLNVTLSTTGDLAVNTDDLYVDTSEGRVGIGTTAPGEELHVTGQIKAADSALATSDGYLYLGNDGHYLMWDDDWEGKDGDGNDVFGWLKTDEGMSVKHLEVRGASPAAITFGSGDSARRLQYNPIGEEFSFTGGKLKQAFQNLIRNGSFEGSQPTGWYSFNGGIYGLDSTQYKFGVKSLKIVDDNPNASEGAAFYFYDTTRLQEERLTLSFWAKTGTGTATASVGFSDSSSDSTADTGEVSNILLDTTWRQFIVSYPDTAANNIAADANQIVIYLFAAAGSASTSGNPGDVITGGNVAIGTQTGGDGYVYIDGVTLVQGNLAMDYGPSPVLDTGPQVIYGNLAIGAHASTYTSTTPAQLVFGEPDASFGTGYGTWNMGTGSISFEQWDDYGRFFFNRGIRIYPAYTRGSSLHLMGYPRDSGTYGSSEPMFQVGWDPLYNAADDGTYIGINSCGTAADYINFQRQGNTKFRVDYNGNITAALMDIDKSYTNQTGAVNDHIITRNVILDDGTAKTISGDVVTINAVDTQTSGALTDNSTLLKLQTGANVGASGYFIDAKNSASISKFKVDWQGNVTAASITTTGGSSAFTGTSSETFTIDQGSGVGTQNVTLQFSDDGGDSAHYLMWDDYDNRFEFNETLAIEGGLKVTGTITAGSGDGNTITTAEGLLDATKLSGTIDSARLPGDGYSTTYVNVGGDTMTGKLIINENLTTTGAQALDINSTGIITGTNTKTIASISDSANHVTDSSITGLEIAMSGTYNSGSPDPTALSIDLSGILGTNVGTERGINITMGAAGDSAINTNAKIVANNLTGATLTDGTASITAGAVSGATSVSTGTLAVTTTSTFGGDISIGGGYASGGITIGSDGTLSIGEDIVQSSGKKYMSDATTFTGDYSVSLSSKLGVGTGENPDGSYLQVSETGVISAPGATTTAVTIDDAITQTGTDQVIFGGNVNANSGLDVAGANLTLDSNDIIVNTNKFTVDGATGNTTLAGTLTATGNVNANSGLDVTGANLTLDSNDIIVNTNKFTVDGATGNATMAGTLTQLRSIGLTPDYDNAILRGDGDDNFGTLSLKYDSTNYHNYYEWTTDEPTAQDYDIVLRYRLPDGFSSFDAATPIELWTTVSNTTGTTQVDVSMKDTAGSAVTLTGASALKGDPSAGTLGNWYKHTITLDATGKTFDTGGYVTLIIKLSADQGETVDVGELTLKGNW